MLWLALHSPCKSWDNSLHVDYFMLWFMKEIIQRKSCYFCCFHCPLLFCALINDSSNLYCLIDQASGEVSLSHPGRILVVLAFRSSSCVLLRASLCFWLNRRIYTFIPNHFSLFLKRRKKKSKWLESFIRGTWKINFSQVWE
jgi:hypothetical protein